MSLNAFIKYGLAFLVAYGSSRAMIPWPYCKAVLLILIDIIQAFKGYYPSSAMLFVID